MGCPPGWCAAAAAAVLVTAPANRWVLAMLSCLLGNTQLLCLAAANEQLGEALVSSSSSSSRRTKQEVLRQGRALLLSPASERS